MSEILQANIFFMITSVAVVLFTLLVCVALFHVIKILRAVRRIIERVDEGSEHIAEDVSQLREYVMEGSLVSQIMKFFVGVTGRKTASRRRKSDQ